MKILTNKEYQNLLEWKFACQLSRLSLKMAEEIIDLNDSTIELLRTRLKEEKESKNSNKLTQEQINHVVDALEWGEKFESLKRTKVDSKKTKCCNAGVYTKDTIHLYCDKCNKKVKLTLTT